MYSDIFDANGKLIKTASELFQEVENTLLSVSANAALACQLATDGARPGYDGNALHALSLGGWLTTNNLETFAALVQQRIPPLLAENIASESAFPPYDAALVRDLATNGYLTLATVIDIRSLGSSTGPITYAHSQLQKKYPKHAADFGLSGPWNPANRDGFRAALDAHVHNPNIVEFAGTYKTDAILFFLDPRTGCVVLATPAREFISGWILSSAQVTNTRYRGSL